jgi:hypothetical protein
MFVSITYSLWLLRQKRRSAFVSFSSAPKLGRPSSVVAMRASNFLWISR